MKQETQLQLSWSGAVLCFLLYFAISFRLWSSLSVTLDFPEIWDGRITFDIDLFGFAFLGGIVSNWLMALWPDMPTPRSMHLGWDMASGTIALLISLFIIVFSRKLIGCQIPIGKLRYEAIVWVLAIIVFSNTFPVLFSLPSNLADTTWSYLVSPSCATLLFRPDEATPTVLLVYLAISPIVIAAVSEEIADRGLLAEIFMRTIGVWPTALFTSSLFAVAHMRFDLMLLYYFIVGLILFAARVRFGGIGVPILMHMAASASITLPALYGC